MLLDLFRHNFFVKSLHILGTKDFVDDKSCDERGPCFDLRVCYYKHLRTKCFPDACNRCKPRIYDQLFREVCQGEV